MATGDSTLKEVAGNLVMATGRITGLGDPTAAQDGATRNYVDTRKRVFAGPWGNAQNSGNATQRFLMLGNTGTTSPGTVESASQTVSPVAVTLDGLRVHLTTGIVTDTQTIKARINGVDTTITCTVAISGTTASDTTHTALVAAGDLVSLGYQQSGTQAATSTVIKASLGCRE